MIWRIPLLGISSMLTMKEYGVGMLFGITHYHGLKLSTYMIILFSVATARNGSTRSAWTFLPLHLLNNLTCGFVHLVFHYYICQTYMTLYWISLFILQSYCRGMQIFNIYTLYVLHTDAPECLWNTYSGCLRAFSLDTATALRQTSHDKSNYLAS